MWDIMQRYLKLFHFIKNKHYRSFQCKLNSLCFENSDVLMSQDCQLGGNWYMDCCCCWIFLYCCWCFKWRQYKKIYIWLEGVLTCPEAENQSKVDPTCFHLFRLNSLTEPNSWEMLNCRSANLIPPSKKG